VALAAEDPVLSGKPGRKFARPGKFVVVENFASPLLKGNPLLLQGLLDDEHLEMAGVLARRRKE